MGNDKKLGKARFDNIIRKNIEDEEGGHNLGYVGKKLYRNYYSKEAYDAFIRDMENSSKYNKFFKCYLECVGNEMVEKNGTPPKMASVASSSRFCYLALRDGAQALDFDGDVEVEHECVIEDIESRTYPQLDAYISKNNAYIEVKCHEIFDIHKDIVMSDKYERYISEEFALAYKKDNDNNRIIIKPSAFGIKKDNTRFDIKQFLCHLIGIKCDRDKSQEATLVYLFFMPKCENESEKSQIEDVFKELKEEMDILFNSKPIKDFTRENNIRLVDVAEHSKVMEALTKENICELPKKKCVEN